MTAHNETTCTDALLLRYLDGESTPQEQVRIESDADLQQRLAELRQFDDALQQRLRPALGVSAEQLVDFAAGSLDASQALVVGRAIQHDPALQREVEMLRDLLAENPFAPDKSPVSPLDTLADSIRQVIDLFRAPQPASVRGNALRFQGPSVSLTLRQEQVTGEDPAWTVRGLVEYEGEGQPAVVILCSDTTDTSYRTLANDEGIFRLSGLKDGIYNLTLLLVEQHQELRLHQFKLA